MADEKDLIHNIITPAVDRMGQSYHIGLPEPIPHLPGVPSLLLAGFDLCYNADRETISCCTPDLAGRKSGE